MVPQLNWTEHRPSKARVEGSNPSGITKTKIMEEILELIHNEFIESEDYYVFLRRLEEEQEFVLKNTCQVEKFD